VANLTLDQQGSASGTIDLTFNGAAALYWRQRSLTGDQQSLEHELTRDLERMLPGGMEVKVSSIDKLTDYEEPLQVSYAVKGAIGSSAGKRLLIPGDLFETNTRPMFVHEKRDNVVAFHYASTTRDAIRIKLPPSLAIESAPATKQIPFTSTAAQAPLLGVYNLKTETGPAAITVRRDLLLGEIFYLQKEYPDLRSFYGKFETADQEPIVLKQAATASTGD
jgi:hypothetical protein